MKILINFLQKKLHLNLDKDGGLLKDSGEIYVLKIGGLLIGFGLQVFLARLLGIDEFGVYIYVLTWVNIISFFSKLGFDTSPRKFLSIYYNKKQWNNFSAFVIFSSSSALFVSIFSSLVMLAIINSRIEDDLLKKTFYIGSVLLILISQLGVFSSYLESINNIKESLLSHAYLKPILIFVGGIVLVYTNTTSSITFMWINIAASLATFLVMFIWIFKFIIKGSFSYKIYLDNWKIWFKVSIPLLLVSGTHLLLNEMDALVLGILKGTENVGVYKAASKFSQLAMFGFAAVELVIAPIIAKLYADGKTSELQALLRNGVKAMLVLTIPVLIFVAVTGKFLLALYGEGFSIGLNSLLILLASQAINMSTGAVSYLMTMTNYQRQALLILLMSLVINGILNFLLIPSYGLEGAALATAITTILWNLGMMYYTRIKLKLDPSILNLFRRV